AVTTPNKKFGWALTLVKRKGWNLNFNTILEFNWKIWQQDNQYLFVQYYNGYGENMLDYNVFHSRLRVGLVIKPKFFSEF
ncbi:MAG: phospholipase A, partial [Muribaculaceae bacterium]|nr:phospholipase A [Muribaculaceae bacterium]